jgi:hypothetical protein
VAVPKFTAQNPVIAKLKLIYSALDIYILFASVLSPFCWYIRANAIHQTAFKTNMNYHNNVNAIQEFMVELITIKTCIYAQKAVIQLL